MSTTAKKLASELVRIAEEVKMLDIPDTRQTFTYDCGAKATQTVLAYYGVDVREDKLMKFLGTTTEGTDVKRILAALHRFGLKTEAGQLTVEKLRDAIRNHWPVIMPIQAWVDDLLEVDWSKATDEGHYVIAIGFRNGDIIFEDPAAFEKQFIPEDELETRWHDFDDKGNKYDHFGIIVKGDPEYSSTKIEHME